MTTTELPAADLALELAVSRAGSAARRGDLDAAVRLLRDAEEPTPAALDLLARIHAQRGEFADADACWEQVQQLDPANPDAAAGRRAIASLGCRRSPARHLLRPRYLGGLVAACVIVAAASVAIDTSPAPLGPIPHHVVPGAPAPDLPVDARRAAAIEALARDLAMPGVRVDKRPDDVRVTFEEGLFSSSDRITPAGEQALATLGRRLVGRKLTTTIVGHTVTVPGGPSSGGSVVALARALVAARALADASGAPLTSFTLLSGDQTQAPFRDAAKNRTVILTIGLPSGS